MKPVSIIMASWNGAATIGAAVASVQRQTWQDWELLICDDGSSDATESIVRSFGDKRIVWLPGQRSGRPAFPRNRGLRASRGEWLAILDQDDEWLPDKLERQLRQAAATPCLALAANARRLFPERGIVGNMMGIPRTTATFAELCVQNFLVTSSIMFHRSLLANVGGFPEEKSLFGIDDYALWLRITCYSDFGVIFDPLLIYRDDAGASSRRLVVRDVWSERKTVFGDFLQWAATVEVPDKCRQQAQNVYQQAVSNCRNNRF